ncbi:hypothetical protein F2P56_033695 [Juglans regia]|uniref:Uncharacterized protein n=1 Tax=Juglans regia TaxID=51240 RepID=A0A833SMJ4_JUGRE|nr:hypothetical protein F2P56_033695 [Juglans regia]
MIVIIFLCIPQIRKVYLILKLNTKSSPSSSMQDCWAFHPKSQAPPFGSAQSCETSLSPVAPMGPIPLSTPRKLERTPPLSASPPLPSPPPMGTEPNPPIR